MSVIITKKVVKFYNTYIKCTYLIYEMHKHEEKGCTMDIKVKILLNTKTTKMSEFHVV